MERDGHIGVGSDLAFCHESSQTVLMARPLRVEYEGALYHVTSRGSAQQDLYVDDEDRDAFLEVLAVGDQKRCVSFKEASCLGRRTSPETRPTDANFPNCTIP